jgi:hypothetical protein
LAHQPTARTITSPTKNTITEITAVRALTVLVAQYSRIGCRIEAAATAIKHRVNLPRVISLGLFEIISSGS